MALWCPCSEKGKYPFLSLDDVLFFNNKVVIIRLIAGFRNAFTYSCSVRRCSFEMKFKLAVKKSIYDIPLPN